MHRIILEDMQYIHDDLGELSKELYGKSVLITGAAGMIPSYCAHYLMFLNASFNASIKVYAMVRNRETALDTFKEYAGNPMFQIICQDVCQPIETSMGGIDKIDFILHAASKASPIHYGKIPVETITANVIGTYNLLEWCRLNNPQANFAYFSSITIYGDTQGADHPITENDSGIQNNLTYRACYSQAKRLGETLCWAFAKEYGINAKMIRIGHVFGPTVSLDSDGRVFADFTRNVVRNEDICLMSDGSAQRSFCYIADGIDGIFRILIRGEAAEAYNLATNSNLISMADLAELLARMYSEKKLKVVRKVRNATDREYAPEEKAQTPVYSIEKIAKLGWRPKFGIEDTFRRTVDYFLEQ